MCTGPGLSLGDKTAPRGGGHCLAAPTHITPGLARESSGTEAFIVHDTEEAERR